MNKLNLQAGLSALITLLLLPGCSAPKQKPVYAEVPGISATPAKLESKPAQPKPEPAPASVQSAESSTVKAEPAPAEKPELIVTPDDRVTGSIVSVNDVGKFAVLQFPMGKVPAIGTMLYAYRQGMQVAELKVTGPQKDDHTVADVQSGECLPHDEVRDQ